MEDKNGQKIFEGDIVANTYYFDDDEEYDKQELLQRIGYIQWGHFNCSCCYGVYGYIVKDILSAPDIKYAKVEGNEEDYDYVHILVVGNIYDNPELLEVE